MLRGSYLHKAAVDNQPISALQGDYPPTFLANFDYIKPLRLSVPSQSNVI